MPLAGNKVLEKAQIQADLLSKKMCRRFFLNIKTKRLLILHSRVASHRLKIAVVARVSNGSV
ncbi:MAG: hypothetical protein AUG51_04750 [Acidobacteria bacterium 13_1_20CM_3_53_8]|nr:MAG: hypothetical protein AUG51_04750 [Acidobacteria bacterium 13_1_20CM_3_53_8]